MPISVIARFVVAAALFGLTAPRTVARPPSGVDHAQPDTFGERLTYDVSFGRLHVGSGEMTLLDMDTVDSHAVRHALFTVSGGIPFLRVHDTTMSWFDTTSFVSRRFVQYIHEGRYHARRDFRIDPERRVYTENSDREAATSELPLDDVSFMYFLRTLPLADGDRYEIRRYFQPEGNPVTVRVIRHERVTVPAGTFDAVLIEPEITAGGVFSQAGHAKVWLSDDSARVLLQLKSRLSFGSINLYLTHITHSRRPSDRDPRV